MDMLTRFIITELEKDAAKKEKERIWNEYKEAWKERIMNKELPDTVNSESILSIRFRFENAKKQNP